MDGTLKILLLAALTLLVSAQTFDNYRSLPDELRTHIDKALKKANENFGLGFHVAFLLIKKPVKLDQKLYVNVLLQATTCKKTSDNAYEHRDECSTRQNNAPKIDCVVCKTHDGEELVDCARAFQVSKVTRNKCAINYLSGKNTAFRKSDDKEIGCIGCL
ncbi:cystatin-like protein [Silurus meridionalis]|uniref:cystatin-like protein n=1 Tax=Silurus meridionalis TaxID=175797 RepID=UPI001EEB5DB7|nr:cystatin-like protein [Silurus meridionalis]